MTAKTRTALFLAALLLCCCRPAGAAGSSLSLSLDGSLESYGDSRNDDIGTALEFERVSAIAIDGMALDWNISLYYSYSRSETEGESTNANSIGVDLAKLMLTAQEGKKEPLLKPYLLAGAEFTRLKERDGEGGMEVSRFVSPAVGAGLEFKVGARTDLKIEYRRNLAGGDRRLSGISVGLSWTLLGGGDD